ncbi:hypothetical protein BGW37DRAFT_304347 [Umbelopsis sp. PMI_123]|nr:hypothetical protein BGW37DRAFT_304347 [Umbelopsis sp. PMI_123]
MTSSESEEHQCISSAIAHNTCHPFYILPTELLVQITSRLSLPTYIALAMTSSVFFSRLMSREIILYLRSRFDLNPQSGNMIVFAYHTGLITKAPKVCEAIFQEFFSCTVDRTVSSTAVRDQTVRAWAVLYALHRATRVCYEPLLSDDNSEFGHGLDKEKQKRLVVDSQERSIYCPLHQCMDRRAQNLAFIERYVHYMIQVDDQRHLMSSDTLNTTFSNIHTRKTYHTIFLQVLKEGDLNVLEFYLRTYGPPFHHFRLRGDEYDDINIGAASGTCPLWLPMPQRLTYAKPTSTDGTGPTVFDHSAHHTDHTNICRCHFATPATSCQELRRQVKSILEQYGVHVIDGYQ